MPGMLLEQGPGQRVLCQAFVLQQSSCGQEWCLGPTGAGRARMGGLGYRDSGRLPTSAGGTRRLQRPVCALWLWESLRPRLLKQFPSRLSLVVPAVAGGAGGGGWMFFLDWFACVEICSDILGAHLNWLALAICPQESSLCP